MRKLLLITVAATLLSTQTPAQTPGQKPKPGPEHKRLSYFVGEWTMEGDMKANPFGPGGKFTGSEKTEWFTGGFFLVSRSDGKGPLGVMKSLSILGYNADKKVYTYNAIDSMGMAESAEGTVQGDTWTWTNESRAGGKMIKTRFIIKELPPSSYTMKWEISTDGGAWSTVMEGKGTKKTT